MAYSEGDYIQALALLHEVGAYLQFLQFYFFMLSLHLLFHSMNRSKKKNTSNPNPIPTVVLLLSLIFLILFGNISVCSNQQNAKSVNSFCKMTGNYILLIMVLLQ